MSHECCVCESLNAGVLTSGGLLGHAVGSIQGQDRVLGQGLLGGVISFSGATAVTEQVQVSLPRPWADSDSSCCYSLCRGAGCITGAHLEEGRRAMRLLCVLLRRYRLQINKQKRKSPIIRDLIHAACTWQVSYTSVSNLTISSYTSKQPQSVCQWFQLSTCITGNNNGDNDRH